jgi:hypothetical protein
MSTRSRHTVGAVIAAGTLALASRAVAATATTVPGVEEAPPPVTAPGGTYGDEFCNAWIAVEAASMQLPENPDEIPAWYAENWAPLVAEIREYAPEPIADAVNVVGDAAEAFGTTGDFSVLFTPEFSDATAAIYPTFDEGCGLQVVEATLIDYAFDGIPQSLAAGPTAFVVHNDSAAGEAHELIVFRVDDDIDLTAVELLGLPEDEIEQAVTMVNSAYTPGPDTTGGVVVTLTPGRYVYVCVVSEGSVDGAEGTGPPHFTMGMFGEFTVD